MAASQARVEDDRGTKQRNDLQARLISRKECFSNSQSCSQPPNILQHGSYAYNYGKGGPDCCGWLSKDRLCAIGGVVVKFQRCTVMVPGCPSVVAGNPTTPLPKPNLA